MLIKCPECNKDISSEAEKCIYCGYPLNKKSTDKNISKINGTNFDLSEELFEAVSTETPVVLIKKLKERYSLDFDGAHQLYKIMRETKQVPPAFNSGNEAVVQQNVPKCPTCSSTDITRISTTAKVTNAVMFGLLGNKRKKTFHCNSCKYEW